MEQPTSRIPRLAIGLATAAVLFLAITAVLGDRGLLTIRELRAREAALRAKAESLEAQNDKLKEDLRRLREDDAYLERVAREQQGLVRDGETVYRIPEP